MTARWYRWDGVEFLWVGWVNLRPDKREEE
jgi:hypothetical protein